MKACILVGGYGTRLRPLTFTLPKPLVPFCNIPMILHQIIALKSSGVTEIIFLMSQESDCLKVESDKWKHQYDIDFQFCYETEPLGTAGPLRLAVDKGLLDPSSSDPFFVLNSDIVCEYPLKKLLKAHKESKREGTLLVKQVKNWSQYGVIDFDEKSGQISAFIEKPTHFVGDKINAGIYAFSPSILNRINPGNQSLEHNVFPIVADAKALYCVELDGVWKDIGNPIDFLDAVPLYLNSLLCRREKSAVYTELEQSLISEAANSKKYRVIGTNIIDPTAQIHCEAMIGPNVTIAGNCVIGKGVRIDNSVVLADSALEDYSSVTRSIVGWKCSIGKWAHVFGESVLGYDIGVKERIIVNGARVLPHKTISKNVLSPEIVM